MLKKIKHSSPKYKRFIRKRKAIRNLNGDIMYLVYYSTSKEDNQTLSEGEKQ